jgi:hypothetical protein
MYQHVEFCSDPGTLWRKVESKWDWLGVKPDGTYVVGYPRRGRMGGGGALCVTEENAEKGQHGVRTSVPLAVRAGERWYATKEKATDEFACMVAREHSVDGPGLIRIQLVLDGSVAREEFVARRHSTYR